MAYHTRSIALSAHAFSKRAWKQAFSLDEWLFRKEIFKLYRRIARTAYKTHETRELLSYAKGEFIQNKKVDDMAQRKYLLNVGMRQFRDMSKTLGFLVDISLTPNDLSKR